MVDNEQGGASERPNLLAPLRPEELYDSLTRVTRSERKFEDRGRLALRRRSSPAPVAAR